MVFRCEFQLHARGQYLKEEEGTYQLKEEEWYQLMKCRIRYPCGLYLFFDTERSEKRQGLLPLWGAGLAQHQSLRASDQKVAGSSPGRSGGGICFSVVNFMC